MTELPDRMRERPSGDAGDVLSDVLRSVRLSGSMFFLVEASAPWITAAPRAQSFAAAVLPRSQHLISYHVVVEGACWGALLGEAAQPLAAGDILVVPHGDAYFLADDAHAEPALDSDEALRFFREMAAGRLPTVVVEDGGGAARTRFICGFLGCDARPFNPILAALPRVILLRRATGAPRLRHLIDFALAELRAPGAGSRDVLLRLAELMFVEVVRRQIESAPLDSRGDWLAGLRDPVVGRALACIHGEPARAWTLEALAGAAFVSRSVLAERFLHFVGRPPMHYLADWRMQLAARLLDEDHAKVGAVAQAVGYDSEAAFSRAFKKHAGLAPSEWRRRVERAGA